MGGFLLLERKLIMENYQEREIIFHPEQEKFVTRRMVVKIGSSTVTGGTDTLDEIFMENIARQASLLFHSGVAVVIVTSGAVASGKKGLESVDTVLDKQVAALYGQPELISKWRETLNNNGVKKVGQLLVKDDDLKSMKPLLDKVLHYGVVVVNANDPVNDYEMKQFLVSADNDRLAGFIAEAINADTLLLLTDVDGVLNRDGKAIETFNSKEEVTIFSASTNLGTGGLSSKIKVAQDFTGRAVIANGKAEDVLLKVARGEKVGTQFH